MKSSSGGLLLLCSNNGAGSRLGACPKIGVFLNGRETWRSALSLVGAYRFQEDPSVSPSF